MLALQLSPACVYDRPAACILDTSWLLPSTDGGNDAVVLRGALPLIVAELLIGGCSSDIRRQAAAVIKAIWRLLEGQSAVKRQRVLAKAIVLLSGYACIFVMHMPTLTLS